MSNINQYLEDIMSAIRGEELREAILNALNAINEKVGGTNG